MESRIRAFVALVTVGLGLMVPAAGVAVPRHWGKIVLPADYGAWSRVAACESGGWRVLGYAYPDSLGISRVNYLAFGGRPLPPGPVSLRDRVAEIRVADRLIAHYGASVPDQYGCHAW